MTYEIAYLQTVIAFHALFRQGEIQSLRFEDETYVLIGHALCKIKDFLYCKMVIEGAFLMRVWQDVPWRR